VKFRTGPTVCSWNNECNRNNGGCSQLCVDTYDSYYCTCRHGYELAPTTYNCPGISSRM